MDQILRWLAGMGDEPLPPGESLRFEFLSIPSGGLGLLALLGFLLLVGAIWWLYRRDAARLPFGARMALAVLRITALLLIAGILLEPSLVKVRKVVRPGEVLLLLDASQSMSHKDSYQRSAEWSAGWKSIGVTDPQLLPRIELAKKLLGQPGLTDALASKNRVRAWLFGGGPRQAPVKEVVSPTNGEQQPTHGLPPPPVLDFDKIDATEGSTNLTASLRQALQASRGAGVAGVIIISDGRRNAGGSVEEAGAYLKRRKVKEVMVVGVGDPAEAWITTLREVHAAERVFKGDPLKVSAIVSAEGYGAQTLVVVLDEVDEKGVKIRDLHRVQIEVGGDTASASVDFPPVLLAKEGDRFLRIEVEPPFGETKEDRHARTHKVEVLSQKLRLLVVAGSPSHEFRVLRNQMIRDKTIDVSCWLQSADSDFPQDGNSTIKELPKTPKELDVFDVVVMVDADPVLLDRALPPMLRDAITMRGLGLWFVMGEKFSVQAARPGSSMTPLIELLPVEIDLSLAENLIGIGRYFKREFHWELTREGKGHRVTGILTDPTINATLWSKLPGYRFAIPVLRAKPAATVLVRHADKTKRSQDGSWPLIALQFVGAGRVLWSGTDEVNRWRSVAPEAYNRLWVKGLRWLYEGKLAGGSSRYRLGASTEKLTLGQEVDVFLRALDQNFEAMVAPTTKVRLFGPGGQTEDLALAKSEVGDGRYQGAFRPRTTGPWTVQALSEETGEAVGRPVLFAVVPSELESQGPMGLAELTRLAEAAGGSMVSPIDLAQRAQEVRSATTEETFTLPFPLWDKWPTLLLIVLLLSVEWILRKRFDLL